MTVQCIACRHFDMKSNREMAVARAGHCPVTLAAGQYTSALKARECDHFDPAPVDKELMEWAVKCPKYPKEESHD